jgi:hypothetical protein
MELRLTSDEYTREPTLNTENSTNILLKLKMFLSMSIETRSFDEKTRGRKFRDTALIFFFPILAFILQNKTAVSDIYYLNFDPACMLT